MLTCVCLLMSSQTVFVGVPVKFHNMDNAKALQYAALVSEMTIRYAFSFTKLLSSFVSITLH